MRVISIKINLLVKITYNNIQKISLINLQSIHNKPSIQKDTKIKHTTINKQKTKEKLKINNFINT